MAARRPVPARRCGVPGLPARVDRVTRIRAEQSTADARSRLARLVERGQCSEDVDMDRSVAESWASIVGWLERNLPAALEVLQPPAPWSAVSAVREGMGRRLPSDLLAWLNINNGIKRRGDFGNILPILHTPLPCEEMLPRREMLRGIYADVPRPGELELAGTKSVEWLDSFLPISDAGTDVELFVDLRDGDLHGCVGQFDAPAGGFWAPYWTSTADMLADVADALTLGRPALHAYADRTSTPWSRVPAWVPYLDEGRLRWSPATNG
jgi:cell wall assembly regulator SMI1